MYKIGDNLNTKILSQNNNVPFPPLALSPGVLKLPGGSILISELSRTAGSQPGTLSSVDCLRLGSQLLKFGAPPYKPQYLYSEYGNACDFLHNLGGTSVVSHVAGFFVVAVLV